MIFNNKIKFWLLNKLLGKKIPQRDPFAKSECENIECYCVYILGKDKKEKYLLDGINTTQSVFKAKKLDQSNKTIKKELKIIDVDIDEVLDSNFKVRHFYKGYHKTYENIYVLLFSYIIKFRKLYLNGYILYDLIYQRVYNLRPLVEKKKRMQLLRWLINEDKKKV